MGSLKSTTHPESGDAAITDGSSVPAPPPASHSSPVSDAGDGLLDEMASGQFKLSAPVGPGADNHPDDVFRVETVLKEADILKRPPGRRFGNDTADAIKAAQGRLNDDARLDLGRSPLNPDGLVNPDGPTQAAARRLAGSIAEAKRAASPKPAETLDETAQHFAAKGPMVTAPEKPVLPDRIAVLSGDDVQSLERLAQGLRKSAKPGPVAGDIVGAFRADPERATAEFAVIRGRLAETGTAEQVKNLDAAVRGKMSAGEAKRFDTLLAKNANTGGGDTGFVPPNEGGKPPLTGPGGEGKRDERPDGKHQTDLGRFGNELESQGFTDAEAKQRVETYRKLTGPDATPEDKRAAKLYRLGIELDQARELSKLGDAEVDELVDMAREGGLGGGALRQYIERLGIKINQEVDPSTGTVEGPRS